MADKNWIVDEEGNPIKYKKTPPKKHFIVDKEGNPKKYKNLPPEKHWLSGMRRFNRGKK